MAEDGPEYVRETCEWVVSMAKDVRVDGEAVKALAGRMAREEVKPVEWDECGWHYVGDAAEQGPLTAQYVFVVDCINFCFWPSPGCGRWRARRGDFRRSRRIATASSTTSWRPP